MNPAQRRGEFPHQVDERGIERRPPANQHIIVAGTKRSLRRKTNHLTQAAPQPIALDGIADLARYGEADPAGALVAAGARLEDKVARRRPRAFGGSLKVRPAFQPLHRHTIDVRARWGGMWDEPVSGYAL